MLALTLCRSGADSGGYPSRKTDTCDGLTRPRTPTTALVRFDEVEGPPSKYLVDHDRLFIPDFPLA